MLLIFPNLLYYWDKGFPVDAKAVEGGENDFSMNPRRGGNV
jgi:hypothetical protein